MKDQRVPMCDLEEGGMGSGEAKSEYPYYRELQPMRDRWIRNASIVLHFAQPDEPRKHQWKDLVKKL